MSSKRRNLSALVFLINSTTKVNLTLIIIIVTKMFEIMVSPEPSLLFVTRILLIASVAINQSKFRSLSSDCN